MEYHYHPVFNAIWVIWKLYIYVYAPNLFTPLRTDNAPYNLSVSGSGQVPPKRWFCKLIGLSRYIYYVQYNKCMLACRHFIMHKRTDRSDESVNYQVNMTANCDCAQAARKHARLLVEERLFKSVGCAASKWQFYVGRDDLRWIRCGAQWAFGGVDDYTKAVSIPPPPHRHLQSAPNDIRWRGWWCSFVILRRFINIYTHLCVCVFVGVFRATWRWFKTHSRTDRQALTVTMRARTLDIYRCWLVGER